MKRFFWVLVGVFFLSFSAFSSPIVVTSIGRGSSEAKAISAAKHQAVLDAEMAGFFVHDGYRTGTTRIVDVTRTGSEYIARIAADVSKDSEYKQVLFVLAGDDMQVQYLHAVMRSLRASLSVKRNGQVSDFQTIDVPATGLLKSSLPVELDILKINEELDQLVRIHKTDTVYLLRADIKTNTAFLVSLRNNLGTDKNLRVFRANRAYQSESLAKDITDAVRHDFDQEISSAKSHSIVTLSNTDIKVRKGQSVLVYSDKLAEHDQEETSIVMHGVVTETFGSKVRILTERAVDPAKSSKLRFSPIPKRGVVIKESDW